MDGYHNLKGQRSYLCCWVVQETEIISWTFTFWKFWTVLKITEVAFILSMIPLILGGTDVVCWSLVQFMWKLARCHSFKLIRKNSWKFLKSQFILITLIFYLLLYQDPWPSSHFPFYDCSKAFMLSINNFNWRVFQWVCFIQLSAVLSPFFSYKPPLTLFLLLLLYRALMSCFFFKYFILFINKYLCILLR